MPGADFCKYQNNRFTSSSPLFHRVKKFYSRELRRSLSPFSPQVKSFRDENFEAGEQIFLEGNSEGVDLTSQWAVQERKNALPQWPSRWCPRQSWCRVETVWSQRSIQGSAGLPTERASGNSKLKSRERVENKTQFRHIGKYEEQRKYPISNEECEWEGSEVEKELGGLLFYQDRCMFLTSLINEKGGGEVNQFGDACASPFSFQIEIGFCIYRILFRVCTSLKKIRI